MCTGQSEILLENVDVGLSTYWAMIDVFVVETTYRVVAPFNAAWATIVIVLVVGLSCFCCCNKRLMILTDVWLLWLLLRGVSVAASPVASNSQVCQ